MLDVEITPDKVKREIKRKKIKRKENKMVNMNSLTTNASETGEGQEKEQEKERMEETVKELPSLIDKMIDIAKSSNPEDAQDGDGYRADIQFPGSSFENRSTVSVFKRAIEDSDRSHYSIQIRGLRLTQDDYDKLFPYGERGLNAGKYKVGDRYTRVVGFDSPLARYTGETGTSGMVPIPGTFSAGGIYTFVEGHDGGYPKALDAEAEEAVPIVAAMAEIVQKAYEQQKMAVLADRVMELCGN